MRNVVLVIFYIVFLLPMVLHAQYHHVYNTGNGFLSNNVYHIVKDSREQLWFCTDKGVIKYNGQTFTHYRARNGLTDNEVFNAYEDAENRMWFFTFNGYYCFYKNDTIYNANNDSLLRKIETASYINAMYEDEDNKDLYIAHVKGPIRKVTNGRVTTFYDSFMSYEKVRDIYKSNGVVKVSTRTGIYNIVNDSLQPTRNFSHESYYTNGKFIICDEGGVKIYDNENITWQVNDVELNFSDVYDIYYDKRNYIFCGTKNGLVVYNISTNQKQKFFPNTRVSSSICDKHGNIWVSTLNKGVIKFYRSNLTDIKYIEKPAGTELITTKSDQSFTRDKNHIQHLYRTDTGVVFRSIWTKGDIIYEPAYINDSIIIYFSPIGTRNKTETYVYNFNTGAIKELDSVLFNRVYETDNNNLLLFLNNEIRVAKYDNNKLEIINSLIFDKSFQSEKYIRESNTLYFFHEDIFYSYNVGTDKINVIDTLKNAGATKEVIYKDGKVLLLINNRTLITYAGDILKEVNRQNINIPLYNITKIEQNKYVINTNEGFGLLQLAGTSVAPDISKIYYPFEQKDIFSISPLDSEYLLCHVNDQFYYLHKSIINSKSYVPELYLTHITLDDKALPAHADTLLADNKTNINVNLSPVYFGSDELSFRYRISDKDDIGKWNYTQSNLINFSINSSGSYNVEFQAVSSYGFMSEPQSIYIVVTPTFFSSPLFYVLLLSFLLILIFLLFLFYNKRKKTAYRRELNYMQLQHKAVNSLLNPHFIFNAINNIQNLVNQDSKESANEYLATLSIMIRQNIENLQYELIPLKKELQLVVNYVELQNLRFNDSIKCSIESNISGNVRVPPLLIHTFVENAIVHGFDKTSNNFHISINILYVSADYIKIIIEDNGLGINHTSKRKRLEKSHISLGIPFNKDRLERLSKLHNAQYELNIEELSSIKGATGTRATILLYSKF